ncbi:MAG: ribonuclease H-like domain-containing protein [Armatimonadetes bacterium]|nr:ribonuclease H-like domain-containing protein [Armatimonadota bacterium]
MLTSTFIHVQGITTAVERKIWEQGARTWDDFLADKGRWLTGDVHPKTVERIIQNSRKKLAAGEHRYFGRRLPRREAWRVYPEFANRLVYLDIETDGGFYGSSVTVVGVYDGADFRAFVQGDDLDEFPEYISRFGAIVTFFGSGFDLPMLRRRFPGLEFDQLHIDLCHALRRLGFRGGLKKIERQLGIGRGRDTVGLSGLDAIRLWQRYTAGDGRALERLVRYNREDVVNLEPLMRFAYDGLREFTLNGG